MQFAQTGWTSSRRIFLHRAEIINFSAIVPVCKASLTPVSEGASRIIDGFPETINSLYQQAANGVEDDITLRRYGRLVSVWLRPRSWLSP